jgi:hypothetical protein
LDKAPVTPDQEDMSSILGNESQKPRAFFFPVDIDPGVSHKTDK